MHSRFSLAMAHLLHSLAVSVTPRPAPLIPHAVTLPGPSSSLSASSFDIVSAVNECVRRKFKQRSWELMMHAQSAKAKKFEQDKKVKASKDAQASICRI